MTARRGGAERRERPILFSGPMVRALLDGRKTQTRRVVSMKVPMGFIGGTGEENDPRAWGWEKEQPGEYAVLSRDPGPLDTSIPCPYGVPGDRLWVKETFSIKCGHEGDNHRACVLYYADEAEKYRAVLNASPPKKPSIFMPRWASRLTLEVTDVRVERVQAISEDDCAAEGLSDQFLRSALRAIYRDLWDSINGKRPGCAWADNPWVWAITFRRLP